MFWRKGREFGMCLRRKNRTRSWVSGFISTLSLGWTEQTFRISFAFCAETNLQWFSSVLKLATFSESILVGRSTQEYRRGHKLSVRLFGVNRFSFLQSFYKLLSFDDEKDSTSLFLQRGDIIFLSLLCEKHEPLWSYLLPAIFNIFSYLVGLAHYSSLKLTAF